MSQTNTMAMGGGQITQNVVTSSSQPNQPGIGVLGQQVNPATMSPRLTLQVSICTFALFTSITGYLNLV